MGTYSLGLDLGIGSIGWALMKLDEEGNFKRIQDVGVRIFRTLEDKDGKLENATRRMKRGQRRLRRRRQHRLLDLRKLLKVSLNLDFNQIDLTGKNPWGLRLKGLNEELTKEEFAITLYHYCKHRGFKSNRKVDDSKVKPSSEDGKILSSITSVRNILTERQITVTEYIDEMSNHFKDRITNAPDHYINSFDRQMILDEIIKLINTQITFGLCDETFKDAYINLWSRQRDFSEGPGKGSIYGSNGKESLIERMMGTCRFDHNMRAPKAAFSAESFVFLSFLNNLRYKDSTTKEYTALNHEQLQLIYNKALKTASVTYKTIVDLLKLDQPRFKGLEFSRKEYAKKVKEFTDKSSKTIQDHRDEFNDYLAKELLNKKIKSLETYHSQLKVFEKCKKDDKGNESTYDKFTSIFSNFDTISLILALNKTDKKIREACQEKGILDEGIVNAILHLDSIDKTIDLSIELCQKLIPLLLEGKIYDKAMLELGYDHAKQYGEIAEHKYLPPIGEIISELGLTITNVNVIHMLSESRKVINEIIKECGKPETINIELARDLSQTIQDRYDEQRRQLDGAYENTKTRDIIYSKYPNTFRSIYNVNRDDIIRYRLFKEQGGFSPYSQLPIHEKDIFNHEVCEVDHILPYSRTFNDSYLNKALVLTSDNQEKGNQTPYEALKGERWNKFTAFLQSNLHRISTKKKDVFLTKEIDEDFISRNLNDTRYASKLVKDIIKAYLRPNNIIACNGSVTSHLKSKWGIGGFIHSLVHDNMERKNEYLFDFNKGYLVKSENSFTANFKIKETNSTYSVEIKKKTQTGTKSLTSEEENTNKLVDFVDKYRIKIDEIIEKFPDGNINKIYTFAYEQLRKNFDINNSLFYDYFVQFLAELLSNINQNETKKNRDDHLHHVTDAVVIACCTKSLFDRVTKYYQFTSDFRRKHQAVDEDAMKEAFGAKNKYGFPLPYAEFQEDVKNRIYQRDDNKLQNRVKELKCYDDFDEKLFNNLTVVYPSRSPIMKESGPLHKETIFGESKGVITKRIDVHSLTLKTVEDIFDKDNGNKAIYLAVKDWLNRPDKVKAESYPILPSKNTSIKKVKLIETDDINSRIKLGEKRYAQSDDVLRVDVYKKDHDDRLYFVANNAYQIAAEKIGKNVAYTLWWGQGEKKEYVNSSTLYGKYKRILKLFRYTLAEIEKVDGSVSLCYIGGLTLGKLEVYSLLGDSQDLVGESNLFNNFTTQYRLTVSTIKSIKVKHISILGKIKQYEFSPSTN